MVLLGLVMHFKKCIMTMKSFFFSSTGMSEDLFGADHLRYHIS